MEIRQDAQGLRLTERDRDPRRILIVDQKPDGKVARDVFYRDGRRLVEISPYGPKRLLREVYDLSKDGRTLTVVSRIEPLEGADSRAPNVEIKRIYHRVLRDDVAPRPPE